MGITTNTLTSKVQRGLRESRNSYTTAAANSLDLIEKRHLEETRAREVAVLADTEIIRQFGHPLYPEHQDKIVEKLKLISNKRKKNPHSLNEERSQWIHDLKLTVLSFYRNKLIQAQDQPADVAAIREAQAILFSLHTAHSLDHIPNGIAAITDKKLVQAIEKFSAKVKSQDLQKQAALVLYDHYISATNKAAKQQLAESLIKLLKISRLKQRLLRYAPFVFSADATITHAMKQNGLISPVYNSHSHLWKQTKAKLLREYKQAVKAKRSNIANEALQLIYSINNSKEINAKTIRSMELKRHINLAEKHSQKIHLTKYRRTRAFFYQMLMHPHKMDGKLFLSKIPLLSEIHAGEMDENLYNIILMLQRIGGRRYAAQVFRHFFEEVRPKNSKEKLDYFLQFLHQQLLEIQKGDIPGTSENVKVTFFVLPFKRWINRWAHSNHLSWQLDKIKVAKKYDFDAIKFQQIPRKEPSEQKITRKKNKKSLYFLGNVITFLVALGQAGITAYALWSLVPIFGIPLALTLSLLCSSSSLYVSYRAYRYSTVSFLQQFHQKKGLWGKHAKPLKKQVLFIGFLGGIGMGMSLGFLVFTSIMALPFAPFIPFISLAIAISLGSFTGLCITASTYLSLAGLYAKVVMAWLRINDIGVVLFCKNQLMRFAGYLRDELCLDTDVTSENRSLIYRKRTQFVLSAIIKGLFMGLGLIVFCLATFALLNSWHIDVTHGLHHWFHLSKGVSEAISAAIVLGVNGAVTGLFNAIVFSVSFNLLANRVNNFLTRPITTFCFRLVTEPRELAKDAVFGLINIGTKISSYFRRIPDAPHKTILPTLSTIQTRGLHLLTISLHALGSVAFILKAGLPNKVSNFSEIKSLSFIKASAGFFSAQGSTQLTFNKIQRKILPQWIEREEKVMEDATPKAPPPSPVRRPERRQAVPDLVRRGSSFCLDFFPSPQLPARTPSMRSGRSVMELRDRVGRSKLSTPGLKAQ